MTPKEHRDKARELLVKAQTYLLDTPRLCIVQESIAHIMAARMEEDYGFIDENGVVEDNTIGFVK